MSFTRSSRIRTTGTLTITPMPNTQTGWCVNEHKTQAGLLRVASYSVLVFDYPFGTYCKGCAKEIWESWNEMIDCEADEGKAIPSTPTGKPVGEATKALRAREARHAVV